MKHTFFLVPALSILLISCKKEDPKPASNTIMSGELRVTVRMYTSVGQAALSAPVSIALSQDSLSKNLFLRTMNTDEFGYALFTGITWLNTPKHDIFIKAEHTDGGKQLSGTAQATLISNRTTNAQVVVE